MTRNQSNDSSFLLPPSPACWVWRWHRWHSCSCMFHLLLQKSQLASRAPCHPCVHSRALLTLEHYEQPNVLFLFRSNVPKCLWKPEQPVCCLYEEQRKAMSLKLWMPRHINTYAITLISILKKNCLYVLLRNTLKGEGESSVHCRMKGS